MSIWFDNPTVEELSQYRADTVIEVLDIEFSEIGEDYLELTMPVLSLKHKSEPTIPPK